MHVTRTRCGQAETTALLLVLCTMASFGSTRAQAPGDAWQPTSLYDGKFDWIQMKSGEWLKGELIAMYDEQVEFDSEEFEDLVLDWEDIQQIRSSRVVNVGLLGNRSATGMLIVEGDKVTVVGEQTQQFDRADVMTLTVGEKKEINFWAMKVFAGLIVRTGNSEVREVNLQANVKRRTIRNRVTLDVVANQNTTDGEEITNNQRAAAAWDRFISDRFFVQPVFGEYFRDPFQNIGSRLTVGVGAGYELIDSSKIEWGVSGGPAYQETRFDSVAPGEAGDERTPAFVLATDASWDITSWLEFDGQYRIQVVNEESGTYNHHLLASVESDITSLISFDISWIWDRIQDPRPDADGVIPQQDDFRTTVGLTFEF